MVTFAAFNTEKKAERIANLIEQEFGFRPTIGKFDDDTTKTRLFCLPTQKSQALCTFVFDVCAAELIG